MEIVEKPNPNVRLVSVGKSWKTEPEPSVGFGSGKFWKTEPEPSVGFGSTKFWKTKKVRYKRNKYFKYRENQNGTRNIQHRKTTFEVMSESDDWTEPERSVGFASYGWDW